VPFNANLVEISDWLTKIIVGVGLVELHSIPGKLGEVSYYLASGLQPTPSAGVATSAESLFSGQAAGLAILIFYSSLGFLLGYVWTMIYFQRDLKWQVKQLEQQKDTLQRLKQAADKIMPAKASVILPAEASVSANQLDKALASIDEALKNDPNNGMAVMTKARILKRKASQSGQPERDKLLNQALTCADQAITLLPDKGEPLYNKACYQTLLDAKGLKSEVLENLKSAFRLNPDLRHVAKDDHDLAPFKQDADFVKLIGKTHHRGA
jgi:tetratricopeptide (TPR) repeat protein